MDGASSHDGSGRSLLDLRRRGTGLAVALALAAVMAVHADVLLGRQLVFADPYVHPPWSALAPAGGSGLPRMMADWVRYTLPAWELAHEEVTRGRLPLWNPDVFCGHDHAASVQPAVFSPVRWLLSWPPPTVGLGLYVLLHTGLAAAGTVLFLRGRGAGVAASVCGSVILALSGYLLAKTAQPTTLGTFAWLPAILWGIDRWLDRRAWRWPGVISLLGASCFLAGHVQVFVIVALTAGLFFAAALIRRRPDVAGARRITLQLAAISALVVAMAAPQLTSYARALPATRGPGAEASAPLKRPAPELAWSVAIPEPFGSPPRGTFDQPALERAFDLEPDERVMWHVGGLLYPGALALLLLPLGLASLRGHPYLPEALLLLLAFPAVFVPQINGTISGIVPGLGTSPLDRVLLAGGLGWALIVAAGIDRLAVLTARRSLAMLGLAAGVSAIALALFLGSYGHRPVSSGSWFHPAAAGSVALLVCVARVRLPDRRRFTGALLVAIVIADLVPIARAYTPTRPGTDLLPPTRTTRFLQENLGHARFARIDVRAVRPNTGLRFGLRDAQGFAPLFSERYRRVWSQLRPDSSGADVRWLRPLRGRQALGSPLLRLLGVRYVLATEPLEHPEWRPVLRAEGLVIHEAATPVARARLVTRASPVFTDAEGLRRLAAPDFDPSTETVLMRRSATDWSGTAESGPAGSVRFVRDRPRLVELEVESSRPALLVLADTFHPDWTASIDGEPAGILRADVAFRAVTVPAGRSTVVFRYAPAWVTPSLILSGLAAAIGLVLACRHRRRASVRRAG